MRGNLFNHVIGKDNHVTCSPLKKRHRLDSIFNFRSSSFFCYCNRKSVTITDAAHISGNMSAVYSSRIVGRDYTVCLISPTSSSGYASFSFPFACSSVQFSKFPPRPSPLSASSSSSDGRKAPVCSNKSSEEEAEVSGGIEDEWLQRLPDKKKPLYSHSLPCLEAWLRSLGFYQSKEDRAIWFVEKPDWHAQLSLDVTDLYIRSVYLFAPMAFFFSLIFLVLLYI